MEPENKKLDTPYTKDDVEKTDAAVNQRVKDAISSLILAYLHEFHPEYTHDEGAESIVESVLPVVLCLVEDGMRTGEYMAERRIAQMLMNMTSQQPTPPGYPSSASSQN
jgi:hypothetical protein